MISSYPDYLHADVSDGQDVSHHQQEVTDGQLVTMILVPGTVDSDVALSFFFSFLRRAPHKKLRSAQFLETAHRAVLIKSLITWVNSGPTILRSCFFHWIIILFHCLFFLFEVWFWNPNKITYYSQGWSLIHRPSTFLFLLNNLFSVLFLGESIPQNTEAW